MTISIYLNSDNLHSLDLSPAQKVIEELIQKQDITSYEQQVNFKIDYRREENDPRELSEIPEVRLWFVRLDAVYPWLPLLLDWKSGELARYAAMLVPHQFNRSEGIIYNPEALEIFVMQKVFVISNWLEKRGMGSKFRVKSMAQIFGYDLDEAFFVLLNS